MPNVNNFLNPDSYLAKSQNPSQHPFFTIFNILQWAILFACVAEWLSHAGNRLFPGYRAEEDNPIAIMLFIKMLYIYIERKAYNIKLPSVLALISQLEVRLQQERVKPQTDETKEEIRRLESELNLEKDYVTLSNIDRQPASYCSKVIGAIGFTSALVFTKNFINPTSSCSCLALSLTTSAGSTFGNHYRETFLNAYKTVAHRRVITNEQKHVENNSQNAGVLHPHME